jgi:hypothetical protein
MAAGAGRPRAWTLIQSDVAKNSSVVSISTAPPDVSSAVCICGDPPHGAK